MFGRSFPLFRLFGISVQADLSWLFIAVLVTWSLAGLFAQIYPSLPQATTVWMAIFGAVGLFASIIVHEFAHALVARSYGMEINNITLFLFGGVAELKDEPPSPRIEFMVAVVGPLTSIAIAVLSYAVLLVGRPDGWPVSAAGVLVYMTWINLALALFNLVPAFPLDGGRMARSILWGIRKNLKWATRVTSGIGSAFGIFLMIYGGFRFITQDFIGGMWLFLIGLFLRAAAQQSYQQLLVRRVLEGEPIGRFVQPNAHTVPPNVSVREFVDDYVYRYHHKMFPVVAGEQLVGCVTTRDLIKVPRQEWDVTTVEQLAEPCTSQNTIRPDADAMDALEKMNRGGLSRLIVTDNGHLRGVLSMKDMLRLIALKMEIDEGQSSEETTPS